MGRALHLLSCLFFLITFFVAQICPAGLWTSCAPLLSRLSSLTRVQFSEDIERVFDKDIHYLRIKSSALNDKNRLSTHILDSEKSVFIGILEDGHMYLVAGRYRYDGEILGLRPTLRTSPHLSKGIVIRVEDADGKIAADIESYFEMNTAPRAISCASGVCTILGKTQTIRVGERKLRGFFPHLVLKKVLTRGLRDSEGRALDTELFVIGENRLEYLTREIKNGAYGRVAWIGKMGLFYLSFFGGTGALLALSF